MSTLAKLLVNLGLDSSEYSSGIQKAESQTKGLSGVLKIAAGTALGIVSAIGGMAAASGVFGFVKDAAIGMNATLENSTLQFTTLTGNADFAAEHVKALFVLGGSTPFETQSLINASATMETFGGSTLNTIDNLKLFGDAAAATNAAGSDIGHHLEEISYWSSRMNASMASGRPVLETANALQRLGVISPDTMNKLIAMEAAGASGASMWATYQQGLTRFTGAMALQSQTWSGLMSSISDNARMVVATAFKPLFEEGKKALGGLLAFLNNLAASGAAERFADGLRFVIAVLIEFGGRFIAYAKMAYTWGSNIASQFASGIASAINVIVGVMQQIGSVIASWLSPGSPPKITPDLDKWGAEAATIYFEGWAKGDTSAFKSIASTLDATLKGLVDVGKFGKEGVIPTVLAGRAGLSKVFSELATLGDVSQSTFDSVVSSMGPAGTQIAGLIRAYSNLSRATRAVDSAQSELNSTTEKYAAMLTPLNAEMKALQDREKEIKDMQRIDELNASLVSGELDAAEAELARNEIAQINLQKQIKGVTEEKDAVTEAAQAKLDAAKIEQANAQTQVESQQQAIDNQNETNQLIGQQIALVEQMAKAAASAKGGGGVGASAGIGASMTAALTPVNNISKALVDAQTKFDETKARAQAFVDGITENFTAMGATVTPALDTFKSTLAGVFSGEISPEQIVTQFSTIRNAIVTTILGSVPNIIASLQTWSIAMLNWAATAAPPAAKAAVTGLLELATLIVTNAPAIVGALASWVAALVQWVLDALPGLMANLLELNGQVFAWIGENGPTIAAQLASWAGSFALWVLEAIPQLIVKLGELLAQVVTWIVDNRVKIGTTIEAWGTAFDEWITTTAIPGIVKGLGILWTKLTGWISEKAALISADDSVGKALWDGVIKGLNDFWDTCKTLAATLVASVIVGIVTVAKTATKVGKAIIDGIKKGITDAWNGMVSWLTGKLGGLIDAGMAAINGKSPSKDFADQLGNVGIMGGIMLGMSQGLPRLLAFIGKAGRKILAETLGVMASFGRSAGLDVFRSLLDIQNVPTFQPLVESTKAFQDAQENAAETAEKLKEVNDQIAMAQSAAESVKNNEKLADLYQKQTELLKEQAEQKKAVWDTGLAVHAAEALSNEQKNAIGDIARRAREAFEAAQAQAKSMMNIDAKGALEFFNARKAQIEELAALEKEKALATTEQQRADLQTQIDLLQAVQAQEKAQQEVQIYIGQQGGSGVYGDRDIIKIIENALRNAGISVDIQQRTA